MEKSKIDTLYKLLENPHLTDDEKAAIRYAIFELEKYLKC